MAGSRLCLFDREMIERGCEAGESLRAIGRWSGRSPSTIQREMARNSSWHGSYRAANAQREADGRARRPKRALLDDRRLLRRVERLLKRVEYSPAATAAVLRRQGMPICAETIYRGIYQRRFGDPRKVLRRPRSCRRPRTRTGLSHPVLGNISLIGERPARAGVGHWEGDLLVGKRNLTAVVVLTEIVTRFTLVVALTDRTADRTAAQLIEAIRRRVPRHLRQTLTFDQGREFTRWASIATATGFGIYFCEPRSSWQKPLAENTNALLRRWLPKGTVISKDQRILDKIARLLNNMPRHSLEWETSTMHYRQARVTPTM